jgi:hypothetical protein
MLITYASRKAGRSAALGRKVSDEFTVLLCRGHDREVHRCGDETAWWRNVGIDPTVNARALWLQAHPLPAPQKGRAVMSPSGPDQRIASIPGVTSRSGANARPPLQPDHGQTSSAICSKDPLMSEAKPLDRARIEEAFRSMGRICLTGRRSGESPSTAAARSCSSSIGESHCRTACGATTADGSARRLHHQ